ncbi:hypothetical protein CVT24_005127 [Panaeolus cyanescens]|uniref:Ribosomal RNA-processing protein 17 n=1 Tax=Panaeolus cyanescens TaxID=181874 RepID=A0A409VDV6_9AGAR|nr:hypothetical protein CVT24_005127 [Panaeolus cyanescens]
MSSNYHLLTKSHNLIAAKKKAKRDQVKEVLFDDEARREFLTGFHKRKLAKAEAARNKAKEREKQERLQLRREQRQMLREKAIQNAAQVESAYGAIIGDDDDDEEWSGIDNSQSVNRQHDEEYENEETLATVTIVEDFDPDTIIHGPPKSENTSEVALPRPQSTIGPSPKKGPIESAKKKKVREKKIRYQTKDARKREQVKQRARRTEKAERAGGKASRKPNNRSKRR